MRKILRRFEVVTDEWEVAGATNSSDGLPSLTAGAVPGAPRTSASSDAPPSSTASAIADTPRTSASSSSLIIPLAALSEHAGAPTQRLGVALKPADKAEDLAPFLGKVSLVTIEFPNPGDGRGYTQAKLLRERYHFVGEIRAVGAGVKQDLLFYMARSGIDSFDLAPGEDFERAQRALAKYNVAYQPGAALSSVQRQRFFS